jgi:Tol biopolymer transport system component
VRNSQIWLISFESGEVQRITRDLVNYRIASVTRDGRSLVTVAADVQSSVWRVPLPTGDPVQITKGKYDGNEGLATLPDGRVAFSSTDTGETDLYICNADGTDRRQLFPNGAARYGPAMSPDGTMVAFLTAINPQVSTARTEESGMRLNIASITGGASRILAESHADPPSFTPDRKNLIFVSGNDGSPRLMSIPVDGGRPSALTDYWSVLPAVSPDGKSIVCFCQVPPATVADLCVLPITGGPPLHRFPAVLSVTASLAWSSDSKSIFQTSISNDRSNVYVQPLDGSPQRKLTKFTDLMAGSLAPSRDGKNLFLTRADVVRDAVLITGFE